MVLGKEGEWQSVSLSLETLWGKNLNELLACTNVSSTMRTPMELFTGKRCE